MRADSGVLLHTLIPLLLSSLAACRDSGSAPSAGDVAAGTPPSPTALTPPPAATTAPPGATTAPPGATPPPPGATPPPPAATPPPPPPSSNRAPSIGGAPAKAVLTGATFSFRPTASDPEGDPLTFSVVNRPSWASFDARNGRLHGTPGLADLGRYENIGIAVSDRYAAAQLPAFAIDVVATALGTITVSWVPATEREDGSPLTDLGGHKLYWGPAQDDYPNVVVIDNPGITTYVIDGLIASTYYLAASTLDEAGIESELSPPVKVTVR